MTVLTLAGALALALIGALFVAAALVGVDRGIRSPKERGDHDAPLRRRLVELTHRLMHRCRRGLPRTRAVRPSTAPASPEHPDTK